LPFTEAVSVGGCDLEVIIDRLLQFAPVREGAAPDSPFGNLGQAAFRLREGNRYAA